MLAKGDVFGVEAGNAGSTDSILHSLYSTPEWAPTSKELIYFKVIGLEPACKTSLAFDPERTNLMLEVILNHLHVYQDRRQWTMNSVQLFLVYRHRNVRH